jgi:hypothetical protein
VEGAEGGGGGGGSAVVLVLCTVGTRKSQGTL